MSLVAIATQQFRMRLQVSWRLWLTSRMLERWPNQTGVSGPPIDHWIDNPEARIAEDGRIAIELFVDITGGIINTFLLSASFVIVLWQVGGALTIHGIVLPGYLVAAVIVYTSLTSFGMWMLAMPLVASVEGKAAAEGDFRYALTQARDLAPSDDLRRGNDVATFKDYLFRLTNRWKDVIFDQTKMIALSSANNVLVPAVPLVLAAPKFLAGEMTLGDLMQAAAAFVQVQVSLNWLADNALYLANWSASAHRVAELDIALQAQGRPRN